MKLCTWYLTPCKLQLRPVSFFARAKSLACFWWESSKLNDDFYQNVWNFYILPVICFWVFVNIPVGGELSSSIEPILSPVILKMWASHVSDPFISIDLIEVLEVILAKHTRTYVFIDFCVSILTGLYGILILHQFLLLFFFQVQSFGKKL